MALEPRPARLAVLIDADNASAKIAGRLFEEIAKIGEASVRRIYGDFSGPRLKPWADILAKHAIVPHQQFANAPNKNGSDIALVVDAMDLLHSGRFEGFCLVSSDSDFTRLATRIREHGVQVYGFGKDETPESFRRACLKFIPIDKLQEAKARPATSNAPAASKPSRPPSAAVPLLRQALSKMKSDEGWVNLGALGDQVAKLAADFDLHTYGCQNLTDLVRRTGAFEVEPTSGGRPRVRLKPPAPASTKKATKR